MSRTVCSPRPRGGITVLVLLLMSAGGAIVSSGDSQAPEPAQPPQWLQAFLTRDARFGPRDLKLLEEGRAVTRVLDTEERREIAILGAVRIDGSEDHLVERLRDIVSFKKNDMVLQIGRFGVPPSDADLAPLVVDEDDLDELRDCRPGDCAVQMSVDAMGAAVAGMVDATPGWQAQVSANVRRVLLDLMTDYQRRGLDALMEYRDHGKPLAAGAEARAVVRASPSLLDVAASLREALLAYPAPRETIEHEYYWSRERFGFKPTISLTHVVRQDRRANGDGAFFLASVQLYASHYFDASLGVTAIVRARGGPAPAHYMVYTNRTRNSRVGGAFGALIRAAAERRARAGMERLLTGIKASEERLGG